MHGFFSYLYSHHTALLTRLAQHIYLSLSATLLAILIGVPAGIWVKSQRFIRGFILGIANLFQTIPSLALLAFLVPFLGIGVKPTITTLTVYALLPVIRNTYTGLIEVSPIYKDAARAVGFTAWQRLYMIELPLAMPTLLSGIRIATVITIGITTIAAFIGAGGLGDFIVSGLSLGDNQLILLGAIPTAILALALDFVIGNIETSFIIQKETKLAWHKYKFILSSFIVFLIILVLGRPIYLNLFTAQPKNYIVIASKNFTESYILSDIMAELIATHTNLQVIKKYNLATTQVIQQALENGEVDLYPEYTGTAYMIVLHQTKILPPKQTLTYVSKAYKQQFKLIWLPGFGFSNSQALAVTQVFAQEKGVTTFSDLAAISENLILAAPAEFLLRADAYPLLQKAYGFKFKKVLQMEPNLLYTAIANNDVDVIEAFSTDAKIFKYKLITLIDNKHVYPPYDAAPVIRAQTLTKYPAIKKALSLVAGRIDEKTMVHLNYLVDVEKQTPKNVAHHFLKSINAVSWHTFYGEKTGPHQNHPYCKPQYF